MEKHSSGYLLGASFVPCSWLGSCLLAASCLLGAACGQEAPPEPESGPYHPLVQGAWWEYRHTNWTERVTLADATFNGEPAFMMSDSPNPGDGLRSDSIIAVSAGRVLRMTKDEYLMSGSGTALLRSSVNYGVGFTRWNEEWAARAVGYTESPEYVRVETAPDGSVGVGEARKHTFEVVNLSEEVVTPKGTFDCIAIRRTKDWQAEAAGVDLADAQTKTFWFARGVGKVQEKNEETGSTEVLIDFQIPDTPDSSQ